MNPNQYPRYPSLVSANMPIMTSAVPYAPAHWASIIIAVAILAVAAAAGAVSESQWQPNLGAVVAAPQAAPVSGTTLPGSTAPGHPGVY